MKQIAGFLLVVGTTFYTQACDICGCAASSFSLGYLPGNARHFVGVRSNFRTFNTTHPPSLGIIEPNSKEQFLTSDLIGRWAINRRWQVIGVIPFVSNWQQPEGRNQLTVSGLGDLTLLGNYVFINNTDSLQKLYKQTGTMGGGIKFPTGNSDNTSINNRNMLPGSGSWDFVVQANYSIQKGSWGFQSENSFTYRGENQEQFRFGHAFQSTDLIFFRWKQNQSITWVPQLGVNFNHSLSDRVNNQETALSFNGGTLFQAQASGLILIQNWGIQVAGLVPIYQELANGYVKQNFQLKAGVYYFL